MNIFFPSAYVKKIKQEHQEIVKKLVVKIKTPETFDYKKFALTRCPNVKQGNRIFVGGKGDNLISVSVSPINENFRSQIEDGVWEHIKCLLDKNYITLSSCEGHIFEGPFQFIMAVPNLNFAKKIKDLFLTIKFVNVEIKESVSNVEVDVSNIKKPKYTTKKKKVVDYKLEAVDINNMYFRNYDRYWFICLNLYKKGYFWTIFYWIFKLTLEKKCKKKLLNLIKSKNFPISPY